MEPQPCTATPLEAVLVSPVAARTRTRRALETEAFLTLSQVLAQRPRAAAQRLVESAMKLTGAGSAGISVEEESGETAVFRWIATAGAFEAQVGSLLPRDFSPCGAVLDAGKTLLMRDPVRHYPYLADIRPPVRAVLLVPFDRNGKLLGTVWVASHEADKWFTAEDVQAVEGLTSFVTAILDALHVEAD